VYFHLALSEKLPSFLSRFQAFLALFQVLFELNLSVVLSFFKA
jgi:hypothetical protein